MKLIHAVTTYQRVGNLRQSLETWDASRNRAHDWTLIIADDGSTDGTREYLAGLDFDGVKIMHIFNQRRGVHHQTNSIFKLADTLPFDMGFQADDDVLYSHGWDDLYIAAAAECPHLVYHDPRWKSTVVKLLPEPIISGRLECRSSILQGAFWTFNREIIRRVGYFDGRSMGQCGVGHQDYSIRCQRAGLAGESAPPLPEITDPDATDEQRCMRGAWDALGSAEVLRLIPWSPGCSADFKTRHLLNTPEVVDRRYDILANEPDRVYVPHEPVPADMTGQPVETPDIDIIIPIRGRDEMRAGFAENMDVAFPCKTCRIIYAEQADNGPFLRGQLCNAGFMHSSAPVVVFHDIDCRHIHAVDLADIDKFPRCPWDRIAQIDGADDLLNPEVIDAAGERRPEGWGGCTVMTREQFIASGGFSNLPIGWGAEDNIMRDRANIQRGSGTLAHIRHGGQCSAKLENAKRPLAQLRNCQIWRTDHQRDKYIDGPAQMRAEISRTDAGIKCRDITVYDSFKYADLIAEKLPPPAEVLPPPEIIRGTCIKPVSVSIVVPMPMGDDIHRVNNWARCREWWLHDLPLGAEIVEALPVLTPDGRYWKTRTVNLGVQRAHGDFIIVADADVMPSMRLALETNGDAFYIPCPTVHRLNDAATAAILCGGEGGDNRGGVGVLEKPPYPIVPGGGLFALSRKLWESLRGFDERFQGWGHEDEDLGHKAAKIATIIRGDGILLHLWHPPQPDKQQQPNRDLRDEKQGRKHSIRAPRPESRRPVRRWVNNRLIIE